MKFGNRLEVEAVAEWASKYIDYAFLKNLIQKIPARDQSQLKEQTDPESHIPSTLSTEEKDFLSNLAFELRKVEVFYAEQLKDAKRRADLLAKQLDKLKEEKLGGEHRSSFFQKSLSFLDLNSPARVSRSKDDISDQYIPTIRGSPNIQSARKRVLSWGGVENKDQYIPMLHASPSTPSVRKRVFSWSGGGVENKLAEDVLTEPETPKSADAGTPNQSEKQSLLPKRNINEKRPSELSFRKSLFKEQLFRGFSPMSSPSSSRRSISQTFRTKALATNNIRRAMIELYRSLELLKGYRDLNILAYIKIVKKFEKNTARGLKESLLNEFMLTPFYTSTELQSLFEQVEDLYQRHYANGNRHLAMKALRTLGFESIQAKENAFHNLFVGLFTGINIMLLVTIYKFALNRSAHPEEYKGLSDEVNGLLLMYFGFGFPLLISNLIIINMYVWDSYKINYRLVCGVSPRTSTSQYAVFVSLLFVVYLSYVYISVTGQLDGVLLPISQVWVVLILMLTIVANWFKYYQSSRIWLGVLIWRIVSAPLYPCIFKDFFVADQLVSMSPFYQSVGLLLYVSFDKSRENVHSVLRHGSLPFTWYIALFPMIPFFWRAMQCLRRFSDGLKKQAGYTQLINCSRYSLAIMVLVLNTFHSAYPDNDAWVYLALVIRVIYSIFSYYWDINMDWGLGNGRVITKSKATLSVSTPEKEKMIVYPAWVYYFVIATNGLTRFIWLPFSILSIYAIAVPTAGYYLAVIELLRRFQWNFVRVEIEHVHNCEKFQVTEDVDLPFRTQDLFVESSESAEEATDVDEEINGELITVREERNGEDHLVQAKQIWQPILRTVVRLVSLFRFGLRTLDHTKQPNVSQVHCSRLVEENEDYYELPPLPA